MVLRLADDSYYSWINLWESLFSLYPAVFDVPNPIGLLLVFVDFANFFRCKRVCVRLYVSRFPFLFSSFFPSSVNGIYMAVICQHFYNKSTPKRDQQHNKFNIGNLLWFSTKISNISEMSHGVAFFPHDIFVSFMLKGKPNLAAILFFSEQCLKHFITGCPDTKLKFIYSSLWTIFYASILVPTLPNVGFDAFAL